MKNNNIKLEVSNLGPIADASISLKPLTIFIGPNNAGKSYLAIFIYALLNCMSPFTKRRFLIRRSSLFNNFKKERDENWIKNFLKDIKKKQEIQRHPVIKIGDLSEEARKPLIKMIHYFLPYFSKLLEKEMERCYGCEVSKLIRIPPKLNKIEISISQPFCNFNLIYDKKELKLKKIEVDFESFEFELPYFSNRELDHFLKRSRIPRMLIEKYGPWSFLVVKLAVLLPAVYLMYKYVEDKTLRNTFYIGIAIFGLGEGLRNFISMIL